MSAERPLSENPPITLVRPLLAVPKARLAATLAARGLIAADDASNRDRSYERVRLRDAAPALQAAGLSPAAIANSARRLNAARAALDYAVAAFEHDVGLDLHAGVFAQFDRARFDAAPAYLRQRLIAHLADRFGGATPAPRLSEIESLTERLTRTPTLRATLGGIVMSAGARRCRVWREQGRLDDRPVPLAAGRMVVWDARFRITRSIEAEVDAALVVCPLGEGGYRALAGSLECDGVPARAFHALPALWSGGDLLAAPTLAPFAVRHDARFACPGVTVTFTP